MTLVLVGEDEGEVQRAVDMAKTNGLKAFGWKEIERVGDGVEEKEDGGRVVGELEVLVEVVGQDEKGVSFQTIQQLFRALGWAREAPRTGRSETEG